MRVLGKLTLIPLFFLLIGANAKSDYPVRRPGLWAESTRSPGGGLLVCHSAQGDLAEWKQEEETSKRIDPQVQIQITKNRVRYIHSSGMIFEFKFQDDKSYWVVVTTGRAIEAHQPTSERNEIPIFTSHWVGPCPPRMNPGEARQDPNDRPKPRPPDPLALRAAGPVVTWTPETDVPPIEFERSWPQSSSSNISWSANGSTLTMESEYALVEEDTQGHVIRQKQLPHEGSSKMLTNDLVDSPGSIFTDIAFEITEIQSGKVVFVKKIPAGAQHGDAQGSAFESSSQDGKVLASSFGGLLPSQTITFYDMQTWRILDTIDVGIDGKRGIGRTLFSPNGKMLAFEGSTGVAVLDIHSAKVIWRLPPGSFELYDFAFSPDSTMMAVLEISTDRLKIFRLADGREVASHATEKSECAVNVSDSCDGVVKIVWDPKGRFLLLIGWRSVHVWNPFAHANNDARIDIGFFDGGAALSPDGKYLVISSSNFISLFRIGMNDSGHSERNK